MEVIKAECVQDFKCKFKVGDKVKIISLDDTEANWGLTEVMYCIGDESVVETVETCDTVTLRDEYLYHVSDLELVEDVVVQQVEVDNVNSPSHYASQSIECIVAMEAMLSKEEFIGYLRGNIFKYQWRYKQKNGMEDLKKAQWYQSKLIEKEGCL